MRVNWKRRARALNFIDRHLPGADQFNGGGPLLPHIRDTLSHNLGVPNHERNRVPKRIQ
jgi:hypothetical protein